MLNWINIKTNVGETFTVARGQFVKVSPTIKHKINFKRTHKIAYFIKTIVGTIHELPKIKMGGYYGG